jgi:uncharacterized phiE125 gp8 family phage protein
MGLIRVAPPEGEVIPLAELKRQCRVDHDDEDADIAGFLAAAVSDLEGDGVEPSWLGRVLLPQTWALTLDAFPARAIPLPLAPVIAIESIVYVAEDGSEVTRDPATYRLLNDRVPAEIVPVFGAAWPATRVEDAAVRITFRAGYEGGQELDSPPGPSAVPAAIKQALKLIVAHWYANRETVNVGNIVNEMPWAAGLLLRPLRTTIARMAWTDRSEA